MIIPDAAGNKTTDVLHRIVNGGSIGLLFVIPGRNETLRVRGQACVTRDAELLEGLQTGGKPAVLGIGVIVETAFQHCAKAFMRSGLWRPDQWRYRSRHVSGPITSHSTRSMRRSSRRLPQTITRTTSNPQAVQKYRRPRRVS